MRMVCEWMNCFQLFNVIIYLLRNCHLKWTCTLCNCTWPSMLRLVGNQFEAFWSISNIGLIRSMEVEAVVRLIDKQDVLNPRIPQHSLQASLHITCPYSSTSSPCLHISFAYLPNPTLSGETSSNWIPCHQHQQHHADQTDIFCLFTH